MALNAVVLPAPLGPIRLVIVPGCTLKDTPASARTPPNSTWRFSTTSIYWSGGREAGLLRGWPALDAARLRTSFSAGTRPRGRHGVPVRGLRAQRPRAERRWRHAGQPERAVREVHPVDAHQRDDAREADRHQHEVGAAQLEREPPDGPARQPRGERRGGQGQPERPGKAQREQRGRIGADAEERRVAERELTRVAEQEIEAERQDRA